MKFEELYELLLQKRYANPETSTSARYLELGVHEIGKKVVEEAAESWIAAEFQTKSETASEIAQLLYWVALLAVASDVDLTKIHAEL